MVAAGTAVVGWWEMVAGQYQGGGYVAAALLASLLLLRWTAAKKAFDAVGKPMIASVFIAILFVTVLLLPIGILYMLANATLWVVYQVIDYFIPPISAEDLYGRHVTSIS